MRARKSETTAKILAHLEGHGESTAEAVAKGIRKKRTNVSAILLGLLRSGHVSREKIEEGQIMVDEDEGIMRPRYVYLYSITKRGGNRLEILEDQIGKKKRRRR